MKKLAVLSIILLITTGCRCGFLSRMKGGHCGQGCNSAPPAQPCNSCPQGGYSSGYGGYEGEVTGEYYGGEVMSGDYYGGTVVPGSTTQVTGGVPVEGTTISPPMATIPAS